ncbi:hypothetical protein BGX38DRAFT_1333135 [Terfezia claveryi]|nr:hypothetical protein BGX38DRAFT_1333135 [Terfezia claveryi]
MSSIFQLLFRPLRFSGEDDTVCIEDFVDILRFSFMGLELAMKERAKVSTLQSYLDGKAKQYWITLKADKKATFDISASILIQRFTRPVDDLDEWAEKSHAIWDLNNLSQATKFVDGLADDSTKLIIDFQLEAAYTFLEVVKVYTKSTRFLRRKEKAAQQLEKIFIPTSTQVFDSGVDQGPRIQTAALNEEEQHYLVAPRYEVPSNEVTATEKQEILVTRRYEAPINTNDVIRTITDKTHPIHSCTKVDLNITRVIAGIKLLHTDFTDTEKEELGLRQGKIDAIVNWFISKAKMQSQTRK